MASQQKPGIASSLSKHWHCINRRVFHVASIPPTPNAHTPTHTNIDIHTHTHLISQSIKAQNDFLILFATELHTGQS